MIPKVIHYCWFGGSKKPELIKSCIDSWKKYCPDYEIKEWNEDNFDINMFKYTKQAYENKKWAFVTDVARLWIVYNFGGIYMDTDVELFSNLDNYLVYKGFYIYQNDFQLNTGNGFGSEKRDKIIEQMLKDYKGRQFVINDKFDMTPCPTVQMDSFFKVFPEFKDDGKSKEYEGYYFISCDEYKKNMKHYCTGTWVNGPKSSYQETVWKDSCLKKFLRKTSRRNFVKKTFGNKVYSLYIFIAYDFLEYDKKYLFKRMINKIRKIK